MKRILFLLTLAQCPLGASGAPHLSALTGPDVVSSAQVSVDTAGKRGVVVMFLSAICPCSNSHIKELAQLKKDYPQFAFVGVHSNVDESLALADTYFRNAGLPFPVIQDEGAKIAEDFKAYKTPHSYVILTGDRVVYEGGVSSSHEFENAEHKYLRNALSDLSHGRPVKVAKGRTLGCVISRSRK